MTARKPDRRKDLEQRLRTSDAVVETLELLLNRLEQKDRRKSAEANPRESGRYPYVPFPRRIFVERLLQVKAILGEEFNGNQAGSRKRGDGAFETSFVDVGCGFADKVLLADGLRFEAHGIELDPFLVAAVRERHAVRESRSRAYSAPEGRERHLTLYPADALTFDYSGFDVIYFFRPMRDEKLERALERRIWRQARPGAFVIACSPLTEPPPSLEFIGSGAGNAVSDEASLYRKRARPGKRSASPARSELTRPSSGSSRRSAPRRGRS